MKYPTIKVCLQDEIPKFGCGWRRLIVLARGRKWVRLLQPANGRRARINTAVWDQIERCQR